MNSVLAMSLAVCAAVGSNGNPIPEEAISGLRAFDHMDSEASNVLPGHGTRKLMQPGGGGGGPGGPGDAGPESTTAMAPVATTPAPAGITDTTCSLSGVEYCSSYSIEDVTYGTMMTVTVTGTTRDISSNAVPDFDTGYDDTITEDEISYSYPLVPVWTGSQTVTRAPGISIHGIPLDPAGQDIDCDGTALSLEQAISEFGGVDLNGAHVGEGRYHYHGVPSAEINATEGDLVHAGFATDGYMVYYSKSGMYTSGYTLIAGPRTAFGDCLLGMESTPITLTETPDGGLEEDWEYTGAGNLDECNGAVVDGEYAYFITDTFPFISRCLNGEFTDTKETPEGMPGETTAGAPESTSALAPESTSALAPTATTTAAPAGITDTTCSLSGVEYCSSYSIEDATYGTMMTVTVTDTTRDIESNAVPDFDTGYDDTIMEDEISYSYPLVPVWTGSQTVTRAPGISIHGIPLDPAGQDIDCDGTGLSLEQAISEFGGVDLNGAHVGEGRYHYHGVPTAEINATEGDLVHAGFATDGYMVYYSKSNMYTSGYTLIAGPRDTFGDCLLGVESTPITLSETPDGGIQEDWEYTGAGNLDECNGAVVDGEYAYFITDSFPFISRCLNGEFTDTKETPGSETADAPTDSTGVVSRDTAADVDDAAAPGGVSTDAATTAAAGMLWTAAVAGVVASACIAL